MTGEIDNGQFKLDGVFILPSTRTFSGEFKRKLDKKLHDPKSPQASYSGTFDLQLKEQNPDRAVRFVTVNGKLGEMDARAGKYDVQYKIELQDFDKKNIIIEPTVKSDKGEMLDIGLKVYGKMLPEQFTATLNLKNEFKKKDQVNFDLKTNYGKLVVASSIGHFKLTPGGTNFDYKIFTKVNVDPASLEKTIAKNSAIAKFRTAEVTFQGKSSGKIEQNFEWHFINEANINGATKYHANVDLMGNPDSFLNTKFSILAESFEPNPVVIELSYLIEKAVELKAVSTNGQTDLESGLKLSKMPVYQFFKNGGEFLTKVNFRGSQEVKLNILLDKKQSDLHTLTGHLTSTVEKLKDHKVVIKVTQFDVPTMSKINAAVTADYYNMGAPWYLTNFVVDTTPNAPLFEISLDNVRMGIKSSAKWSAKINPAANHFFGELQLKNLPAKDFNFNGRIDWSNYLFVASSPLTVTIKADCEKFHLKGFDLTFKGNKAGQKTQMEVSGTNAGKNWVNGQLDVAEGATSSGESSVLLEGSGYMKWQDGAKRKITFQLIRKKFTQNDQYVEILLNGQLDKRNFLFEFKNQEGVTIARHSICMDGDQRCTNIEFKSDRKAATFEKFEHDFVINFDVRPWGGVFENYYNNFGLTFNTKKNGFDFNTDFNLFIENQHRKYQVSANSKNLGTNIEVTYPNRKIAFEVTHKLPTKDNWQFDFGTSFWLNKLSDPGNKLELRTVGGATMKRDKQEWDMKFNAFAAHPKMKKIAIDGQSVWNFDLKSERLVETTLVFDVFQNVKDQIKVHILSKKEFLPSDHLRWNVAIKMTEHDKVSPVFDQEYFVSLKNGEAVIKIRLDYPKPKMVVVEVDVSAPKSAAKFQVDLLAHKLVDAGATFDKKDKSLTTYANFYHLLHSHPCVQATGKFVYYNHASVNVACDHLATLNFEYEMQKAVALQVLNTAKKVELFNVRVALDKKNFLDSQYKLNEPEIQAFMVSAFGNRTFEAII